MLRIAAFLSLALTAATVPVVPSGNHLWFRSFTKGPHSKAPSRTSAARLTLPSAYPRAFSIQEAFQRPPSRTMWR